MLASDSLSVDRVVGPGLRRRRLLLLAVVDALVVSQAVQARVDAAANVTDGLARGPHVDVLYVPFESREGREALVTGLASVIFPGGMAATYCTITLVNPHS